MSAAKSKNGDEEFWVFIASGIFHLIQSFIVMVCWNYAAVPLFRAPTLTYPQATALLLLTLIATRRLRSSL